MYVNVGKHERDLMDYPFANIPCEIKPRLGVYILELDGYVYIGKAEYRGFQGRCYSYQYDLKAGKGSNKGFDLLQRGAKLTWLFVLDEDMFYKRNYEQFGYKRTFTSLELIEMKLIALFKDVLGDKCVNHVIDEDVLNRYIYAHLRLPKFGVFNRELIQNYLGDSGKWLDCDVFRTDLKQLDNYIEEDNPTYY